jgi:hypothetical protein
MRKNYEKQLRQITLTIQSGYSSSSFFKTLPNSSGVILKIEKLRVNEVTHNQTYWLHLSTNAVKASIVGGLSIASSAFAISAQELSQKSLNDRA